MIGIGWALKVGLMTRETVGWRAGETIVHMTLITGSHRMRAD